MITFRQAIGGLFLVAGAATFAGQQGSGVPSGSAASGNPNAGSGLSSSRRPTVTYYTRNMNGGLFGAQVDAPAAPPKIATPRKKPRAARPVVSVPAENPLADYAFTGLVTVQGRRTALIEHTKTKEGIYIGVGDRFLNGRITDIDGQRITLALNGNRLSLARFENYRFTPLDASAPFLRGAGGGGAPVPAAGMPPGVPAPGVMPVVMDGSPPLTPPVPLEAGAALNEQMQVEKTLGNIPPPEGQALPLPAPAPVGEN